jgi:predicted ATPase
MNAPPPKFEQTATFDEIEADEAQLNARRLQLYSKHALKVGLPVDRIYINHPRFDTGLKTLDRVFQIAPEVTMPHGVRLIGPTGSGKSALFRYFRDSLPRSSLFTEGLGAVGIRFGRQTHGWPAGSCAAARLQVSVQLRLRQDGLCQVRHRLMT